MIDFIHMSFVCLCHLSIDSRMASQLGELDIIGTLQEKVFVIKGELRLTLMEALQNIFFHEANNSFVSVEYITFLWGIVFDALEVRRQTTS